MLKNILVLFLLATAFSACRKTKVISDEQAMDIPEDMPELTFKDINSLYTEEAKLRMKLQAPLQHKYTDNSERFPKGIYVEMFSEKNGELETTLKADSAIYVPAEKVYRVMGNVVVKDVQKNKMLETPVLNWDKEGEKIYTDERVIITEECLQTKGKGFSANQNNLDEYELRDFEGSAYTDC